MTSLIDFDSINAAALASGRSFLQEILPGGKFRSLEYVVRNPRRDDRNPGSFSINYKTGRWHDRAINVGGGDIVSFAAYIRGCDQGETARELANRLSVPLHKLNGFKPDAVAPPRSPTKKLETHSPVSSPTSADPTPRIDPSGDDGPSVRANEMRRHFYPSSGVPMRVKIKRTDGGYANWYRIFAHGGPGGWQAKKPDDYRTIPYTSTSINPFDPELRSDEILWPEGEKDVDSLSRLGLPAFTFGGTGDGLPNGIAEYLKDRRVVILADNDDPGRDHAEKKAATAHAAGAASIKVIHFSELPPKGDVSDFIANGGAAEQLLARIDATAVWVPTPESTPARQSSSSIKTSELVPLASIKPEATDWLWRDRIPCGAQTIFTGWPGVGKSQQQCGTVSHVSTGEPWPDGSQCPCGDTIMLTCEDSYARTVVPRLLAAGANLDRVHALPIIRIDDKTKRAFLLTEDLDELERHLAALPDPKLITIDPITGFFGSGKINSNSVTDIRGALAPLSDLAERWNVAIHTITHPPKTTGSAMNAFIGSQAFIAASRMAYVTTEEMDEGGKPTGRYLMAMVRSSLGPKMPTLAYRLAQASVGHDDRDGRLIIGSHVVWEDGVIDISADAALAAASGNPRADSERHNAREEAAVWLRDLLADGSMAVKDIQAQTAAAGLSWAAVRRAKDHLGIKPARLSEGNDGAGKWLWALPSEVARCSTHPQDAHVFKVSTLQKSEHLAPEEGKR